MLFLSHTSCPETELGDVSVGLKFDLISRERKFFRGIPLSQNDGNPAWRDDMMIKFTRGLRCVSS